MLPQPKTRDASLPVPENGKKGRHIIAGRLPLGGGGGGDVDTMVAYGFGVEDGA